MGALVAANAGAIAVGAVALGPESSGNGVSDVVLGAIGALMALVGSYLIGRRLDPVTGTESSD